MSTLYRDQNPKIFAQDLYAESSTQKHALGSRWVLNDGRVFVYSKAGASALAAGKITQSAAPAANHTNKAIKAAAAIGATSVTGAIGATALTANMYREGYLHINDATGEGYNYKIKEHAAASASSAAAVIYLYDSIKVALVASTSEYSLYKHPCDALIVAPTTLTAAIHGVPPIAVTTAYYFWNQVRGPAAVLIAGTAVIGQNLVPLTTAGALGPSAGDVLPVVGQVMQVNASTEYALVNLCVPGY